jgi:hypothetical protein
MPIVIQPTSTGQKIMNKKMDKIGGGGMDIPMKKKMKMSGKMEDMREYMDTLDGIEVDTLEEGAFKDMMIDIEDGMSKEEFEKTYPGMGDKYDEIKKEIMDRQDETVEENDIEMEEDCGCEDDAMVSVPVQELADILQLAGYENYADKIEEYANEPEEEYSDTEDQLIGLSGGLNRPKKQYPASAPGDNPMDQEPREIEESVEDKLYKSYKDFLEAEEIKSDD